MLQFILKMQPIILSELKVKNLVVIDGLTDYIIVGHKDDVLLNLSKNKEQDIKQIVSKNSK